MFCKTDSGNGDHMCKFDGSNNLQDAWDANPECYFNCQVRGLALRGSRGTRTGETLTDPLNTTTTTPHHTTPQMESCNSWGSPATDAQRKCVGDLWN